MSALECYLNQYYSDPKNLENYKLNYLKNHYYPTINFILNIHIKDFQIGVNSNKDLIWFCDKKNNNLHVIYNHKLDKYYLKHCEKEMEEININDYKKWDINNNINNEISNNSEISDFCQVSSKINSSEYKCLTCNII